MANTIEWKSDTEFVLGGVKFKCVLSDYDKFKTSAEQVVLIKGKGSIDLYLSMLREAPPSNVLEFGVFEGGSPVLLSLLYDLRKYVGIDLRPPVAGLDDFLAVHPVGRRIRIHYRTSQDDARAIRAIVANEFGQEPVDLIIDDASHQYGPSRRSFEIAFPLLRPGGTYVLEDWGWAHWPHFRQWQDAPALSNLIFELCIACAAHPELIRSIQLFPAFAFVRKAYPPPSQEELGLDELLGDRGRRLRPI